MGDQASRRLADLLMLHAVSAACTECGDERVFVPVGERGEFCCTSCDAAVFLLLVAGAGDRSRSAARRTGSTQRRSA